MQILGIMLLFNDLSEWSGRFKIPLTYFSCAFPSSPSTFAGLSCFCLQFAQQGDDGFHRLLISKQWPALSNAKHRQLPWEEHDSRNVQRC